MKNLFALLLLIPAFAFAETVTCEDIYIETVTVEGDRDDGMEFANKLIITFKDQNGLNYRCGGEKYSHLELDHIAAKPLLSLALSAQVTGREVIVLVNTNDKISTISNQLSAILVK